MIGDKLIGLFKSSEKKENIAKRPELKTLRVDTKEHHHKHRSSSDHSRHNSHRSRLTTKSSSGPGSPRSPVSATRSPVTTSDYFNNYKVARQDPCPNENMAVIKIN